MKKINIEKIVKTFDEFSKDEQETILNKNRYFNVEDDNWNEFLIDEFISDVKEKTTLDINTNDIIWEVGSRNSKFGVYSKNIINQLLSIFEEKGVYDIDTIDKFGSFLNHLGGGMCSKNNTEFGLAKVFFEEDNDFYFVVDEHKVYLTEKEKEIITTEINDVIDSIIQLCSDYHTKNEELYNDMISDESVKESLKINEYEFDSETLEIY